MVLLTFLYNAFCYLDKNLIFYIKFSGREILAKRLKICYNLSFNVDILRMSICIQILKLLYSKHPLISPEVKRGPHQVKGISMKSSGDSLKLRGLHKVKKDFMKLRGNSMKLRGME